MNDRTGWSIKGIHARARDAARDAARQEGLTLGEYLNRLLTEDSGSLRNRQPNEVPRRAPEPPPPGYDEDDPFDALERLTNRIEAVEARSTLAISGIDQSVVGLLKRLEQADQANSELGGHVDTLMEDIGSTHDQLKAAIERLEADDTSRRALEGMRAIETALAKLADHVYAEGEATQNETDAIKGRVEAGFADLNERVEGMETSVNARLREAGETFDRAVEAAEQRSQGAANHLADRFTQLEQSVMQRLQTAEDAIGENGALGQRIEALESGMSDAIGTLEDTLRTLQARLQTAEAGTNSALTQLQDTLGTLDTRIQSVARQAGEEGNRALKVEFEARFEGLAKELRSSIDRTRSELAGQIEAAATAADPAIFTALRGDIDGLRVTLEQSEKRQDEALSVLADRLDRTVTDFGGRMDAANRRIDDVETAASDPSATSAVADQLDQFAASVEQRLSYVEAGVSGMGEANVIAIQDEVSSLSATVTARLDGLETRETETVSQISDHMTRLTATLDDRIDTSEKNSAAAIEQLGQTVASITRRMEARHNQALSAIDQKLVDSQRQQEARLTQALQQVSARIDEIQTVSRDNVSPVQRAIASLAARLDALESFNAPPFTDKAVEQEAYGGQEPQGREGPHRPFVDAPDADPRPAALSEEGDRAAQDAQSGDDAPDHDTVASTEAPDPWASAWDAPEPAGDPLDPLLSAFEPEPEPAPNAAPDAEAATSAQDSGIETSEPPTGETTSAEDPSPELDTRPTLQRPPLAGATSLASAAGLSGAPLKIALRASLERASQERANMERISEPQDEQQSADEASYEAISDDAPATDGEVEDTSFDAPQAEAPADMEAADDPFGAYGDDHLVEDDEPDAVTGETGEEDALFEGAAEPETAPEAEAEEEVDTASFQEAEPDYDADLSRWDSLLHQSADPGATEDRDFDAEPPSPDVTVGNYAEDFQGDHRTDVAEEEDAFDPIAELENWSDASERPAAEAIEASTDDDAATAPDAALDTDRASDEDDAADTLFDEDTPPPPRDIPRPALSDQTMPLEGEPGSEPGNYLEQARAAALAAAEEASPKKAKRRGGATSSTTVIAAATVVGLATAGTAGYLYLRGKQAPAPTMLPSGAETTATTVDTPAASKAAEAMAALLGTEASAGPETAPVEAEPSLESDEVEAVLFDEASDLTADDAIAPSPGDARPPETRDSAAFQPAALPTGAPQGIYTPIPAGRSLAAAAEAGDPVAELLHGQDLIADGTIGDGVRLVSAAASDGLAAAQYRLAKLHERGLGVPRDIAAARLWTERAANGNNVKAMHDLAVYFAEGEGGAQSYSKAAEWFGKAAAHGVVDSQYNLAVLYERGLGVTQNLPEAAFWFAAAEREGDSGAGARLDTLRDKMDAGAHQGAIERAEQWRASPIDARANGEFENRSWGFAAPNQVRAVQNAFIALGFSDVSATGDVDTATAIAIEDYEASQGLPVTGRLTPDLIRRLNEGAANAS